MAVPFRWPNSELKQRGGARPEAGGKKRSAQTKQTAPARRAKLPSLPAFAEAIIKPRNFPPFSCVASTAGAGAGAEPRAILARTRRIPKHNLLRPLPQSRRHPQVKPRRLENPTRRSQPAADPLLPPPTLAARTETRKPWIPRSRRRSSRRPPPAPAASATARPPPPTSSPPTPTPGCAATSRCPGAAPRRSPTACTASAVCSSSSSRRSPSSPSCSSSCRARPPRPPAAGGGAPWAVPPGPRSTPSYSTPGAPGAASTSSASTATWIWSHIGSEIELFVQKKPGLSAYANDSREAAESLVSLLEDAKRVVPAELRDQTPVRVGATAGLRALGTEKSEQILQAVRDLLHEKSSFKTQPDWVTVLDGSQEGAYEWVTINYLLGKLGKTHADTVGVVDLGGGSVQMAYAIPEKDAAKAPKPSDGEDSYVKKLFLKGTTYYLYVHSYLNYGLLAARAEILKASNGNGYSNCILGGHQGQYKYGDDTFEASAAPSGASYSKCRAAAVKALKVDEACTHMKCSFGGIWNGGGGAGQKNLFVASFFFDRAAEAGFVNPKAAVAKAKPSDFEQAAQGACKLGVKDAQSTYPGVQKESIPYICMDLVYQYTLLVDGFGVDPHQEMTLVKKVPYSGAFVEAAWPLGSAIEVASSS